MPRLRWLATTECTACWRARKSAEEGDKPLTAELSYRHFGRPGYVVALEGDTYPLRDKIKAAGFVWGDNVSDTDMIFSTRTRKAWQLWFGSADELPQVIAKLRDLGVRRLVVRNDMLSAALGSELPLPVGGELAVELVR
jgi:hypothetical protein